MRYRLRTLLIAGAVGPPIIAGAWLLWVFLSEQKLVFAFLMLAAYFVAAIALFWLPGPLNRR
jgi:hypothetical protein